MKKSSTFVNIVLGLFGLATIFLILNLIMILFGSSTSVLSDPLGNNSIDDIAADYVYQRDKVLICTRYGDIHAADKHRRLMRAFEHDLYDSGKFSDAEATAAIQYAAKYGTRADDC